MRKIIFVFVILLITLIPVYCFAYTEIPGPPVDVWEYWVILPSTGSTADFVCLTSHYPITVKIPGDEYEREIVLQGYKYYTYENGNWIYRFEYEYENNLNLTTNILKANYDIAYSDGSGYYYRDIDISANVNITMPRNGFIDNSNIFSIYVITEFNKHLTDEDVSHISVEVELNGGSVDGDVISNKMYKTTSYSVNELNFYVEVPEGENELQVVYKYDDIVIGSDSVTFTRLIGFVDEDGDGLDDRTGREDNNKIEYDPDVDIDNSVSGMIKFLRSSVEGIRSVANVIKVTFSFLPVQVVNAFSGIIMVAIVIGIWRLIRG